MDVLRGADVSATDRVGAVETDSPLTGPEYWVARSRSTAARVAAVNSNSPLAGPEYWLSSSRLALGKPAAVESDSPLAGPEYLVLSSRSATERVADVEAFSPLAGPEFWVARSRLSTGRVAAVTTDSPLAGPEYWVSGSRSLTPGEAEIARLRGLSGPGVASAAGLSGGDEIVHLRSLLDAARISGVIDVARTAEANSNSPLAGPEYWVSRSRSRTPALAEVDRSSPLAGPEYWIIRSRDATLCTAWSQALTRFHQAKRVEDPVNGASSAGEAAFYIAQYGASDPSLVTLEGTLRGSICETQKHLDWTASPGSSRRGQRGRRRGGSRSAALLGCPLATSDYLSDRRLAIKRGSGLRAVSRRDELEPGDGH